MLCGNLNGFEWKEGVRWWKRMGKGRVEYGGVRVGCE